MGMVNVEDIAASASASIVDAFEVANQINFGSTQRNYGSGTQSLSSGAASQDFQPLNEAEAVAATAKDGSVADAQLNRNAPTVSGALDSIATTLTTGKAPYIIGGLAGCALLVTIIIIKRRK